jgi:hypothetical protein
MLKLKPKELLKATKFYRLVISPLTVTSKGLKSYSPTEYDYSLLSG